MAATVRDVVGVAGTRWVTVTLGLPTLAALAVSGLLVVGAHQVWVQLLASRELSGEAAPDTDRMAALGARIGRASPRVVGLQLSILLVVALVGAPGAVEVGRSSR